jgi:PAS domain S-box-containing protein
MKRPLSKPSKGKADAGCDGDLGQELQELYSLIELNLLIAQGMSGKDIGWLIVTALPSLLEVPFTALGLKEAEENWLVLGQQNKHTLDTTITQEIAPLLADGLADKAFSVAGSLLLSDLPEASEEVPPALTKLGLKSVLVVPVRTIANRFGVLIAGSETVQSFSLKQRLLTSVMANQMAITLENASLIKQARESEEHYRLLAENVTDVIWTTDMNLRPTYVSPSVKLLLGYSVEEAMARTIEESLTLASLEIASKAFAKALTMKGEEQEQWVRSRAVELELKRKDGSTVWAESTISIVRNQDGQPIGLMGVERDVTERKRAEEALRRSEEKLSLTLDSVSEGITVTDLEGNIVQLNQAAARMHGYDDKEELVGHSAFELIAEEDHARAMENLKGTLEHGPSWVIQYTFLRKDGSKFPAELSTALMRDKSGNAVGLVAVTADITLRRQAEKERKELEQKAQILSRLASVGEMASGIAHEINNPLTSVVGFSELLMDRDLPKDIREDIETIHQGAQRVASIVKRLLTFARQQKPERAYININDIITTTLNLRAYEMETSNIKIITQLDPDLPGTIADGSQLQQVFLNIILNAETEMKSAHGKGNLFIKTETIDNTLRISFKDDGPGIAKENLERIFDPFFTTREVGKGTGLGLSICHGIVTEHGGRIYAQSKPGKGATFIVELPLVTKPEQLKLAEPAAGGSEDVDEASILVVDDEPAILRFLSRVLTKEGYQVETVNNGDDALERLKSKRYSLILLDIKLPQMSGIELYKRIQKMSQSLARKVVFITGDVMGTDTRDFLSKSKALHIAKPFDTEQLKKNIDWMFTQVA